MVKSAQVVSYQGEVVILAPQLIAGMWPLRCKKSRWLLTAGSMEFFPRTKNPH